MVTSSNGLHDCGFKDLVPNVTQLTDSESYSDLLPEVE